MQHFEEKNNLIKIAFEKKMLQSPETLSGQLRLSWSNWGFGREKLETSVKRLKKYGIDYIELHGNHYGKDLGYHLQTTKELLKTYDMKVSGICGMFSKDIDLSATCAVHRQNAIDYIKRELYFCQEIGGEYLLVVPGAVGRAAKYDDTEYDRSIETLRIVGAVFEECGVKGAIEPIRSAEVSLIHTFAEAKQYIHDLDCVGIRHINGDLYHMQSEESHIGEAILQSEDYLYNLHLADSNRLALGLGSMDIDTVIRALYAVSFKGFVTPEPLGPGGDPYPAMHGRSKPEVLDALVCTTAKYFRTREAAVKSGKGKQ